MLEEVNRAGCDIETVVCSELFGSDSREKCLQDAWQSKQITVYKTGEKLFRSISGVQTPQGAIALVRSPKLTLGDITPLPDAFILCACEIQDPGNMGTLIRTAAAAGATMVCTTKGAVSARNPKSIRSSAGAFFHLPVIEHADANDIRDYCIAHSIRTYRTDPRKGMLYTQANFRGPCAIFLGNEGSGMSHDAFAGFPSIHIPMAEGIESINVSMAGAVILFEAFRQRSRT
jgi:TrmH family RNA methyltransferase